MVDRVLIVRWVVGSIPHGGPIELFQLFQPVDHDWINKGCSICYSVYGMVHIKNNLLLFKKNSSCRGGSGFPLSLSECRIYIH